MAVTIEEDRDRQVVIKKSNQEVVVFPGVAITVENEDGILEQGNVRDNVIGLNGLIDVTGKGFAGILSRGLRTDVEVTADGSVTKGENIVADIGVKMLGDLSRLFNKGGIDGTATGVLATGKDVLVDNDAMITSDDTAVVLRARAGQGRLINDGVVEGTDTGVRGEGRARIDNNGTIEGATAVDLRTGPDDTSLLNNGGIINGVDFAIRTGAGRDKVINDGGSITGTISLGDGKDVFRNDGIVGDIEGGKGNDTYFLGFFGTVIETDNGGVDLVKTDTDRVLEDNVENVTLIGTSSASAVGNAGNNRMIGNSGSNSLSGAEGKDILTGGDGEDTFRFFTGFGKDEITDYKPDIDGINIENWAAIDSFDDLIANHLTVKGKDLVFTADSDSLTLKNVELDEIEATDFMF